MGFDQAKNIREYRFDGAAAGQTAKHFVVSAYLALFARGARDPQVAKALRIFGSRDHNWHNLSNILEVVQSDVGGKITKAGWASQADPRGAPGSESQWMLWASSKGARRPNGSSSRFAWGAVDFPAQPRLSQSSTTQFA